MKSTPHFYSFIFVFSPPSGETLLRKDLGDISEKRGGGETIQYSVETYYSIVSRINFEFFK